MRYYFATTCPQSLERPTRGGNMRGGTVRYAKNNLNPEVGGVKTWIIVPTEQLNEQKVIETAPYGT